MKNTHISEWIARFGIYGLFAVLWLVTWKTGQSGRAMTMNYAFLAIMLFIVAIFNILGIRRMQTLTADLDRAVTTLRNSGESRKPSKAEVRFRIKSVNDDWERFSKDWENSSGMDCELEEYINEQELLEVTHAGLCSLVPGILTSLGILGTFIGLVIGLGEINFADYNVMTQSVEGLVGGLYVAFYTSIYGISLSIVYNFAFRYFSSGLSVRLERFYDAFHGKFQAVTQKSMIDKLTDNQKYELDKLEASVAELVKVNEQLSSGFGKELGDQISNRLIPRFDDINASLNLSMGNINSSLQGAMGRFQEAQNNALGRIVDSFVTEMQGLLQEPIENMGNTMAEQVENLGGSITNLSESQGEMTRQLGTLISQIEATSENTKTVNESSEKIINQLDSYVEKLNSSSDASRKMVETINEKTTDLMTKLDQYSTNMNDVAQEQKTVLSDLQEHEKSLKNTFEGMEKNQAELSKNIVSFSESASQLAERQADPINLKGIEDILNNFTWEFTKARIEEKQNLDASLKGMVDSVNKAQEAQADQIAELKEIFSKMEEHQQNIKDFTGTTAGILSGMNAASGRSMPVPVPGDEKSGSKVSPEIALLIQGQQEMSNNLKEFIRRLEEDMERRNRSIPDRISGWFRRIRE